MKRRLLFLHTHDRNFDRLLSEAPFEPRTRAARARGAIALIARSVDNALQSHQHPMQHNAAGHSHRMNRGSQQFTCARAYARQRKAHSEEGSINTSWVGFENLADAPWL
jgi:hypothetical protein